MLFCENEYCDLLSSGNVFCRQNFLMYWQGYFIIKPSSVCDFSSYGLSSSCCQCVPSGLCPCPAPWFGGGQCVPADLEHQPGAVRLSPGSSHLLSWGISGEFMSGVSEGFGEEGAAPSGQAGA